MLRVLDLFSGIGGFSLGLERTGGFKTVAFCEIDPFCRRVLAKHWPDVPCYEDVRELTADALSRDGVAVDVICGGFPCQDISTAGKQAGLEADRSGLWFEYLRLIGELRPRHVIVENVTNLLRGPSEQPGEWFGVLLGGLATIGYDATWDCVPASAVGAPHIRDRVWIVAQPQHSNTMCERQYRAQGDARPTELQDEQGSDVAAIRPALANTNGARCARSRPAQSREERDPWQAEPNFCRVVDGLSDELDAERAAAVSALGNAVVPQIPELIGRAILAAHHPTPESFIDPE